MTNILTHIYRVRAILALLLFLSSASLWAQSDDATLINITTLAQLGAIRYDLDGDGMVDASASMADSISYETAFSLARKGSITCTGGCSGYELMNNLDFDNVSGSPSIWSENCTDGACQTATAVDGDNADKVGWAPIGGTFAATFDGNNNVISNLYINRSSTRNVALFGLLASGSNLRNLGIEGGSLSGSSAVGGLVGWNNGGTISACYATGDASGTGNHVGGLVGYNGGGTIRASYATGTVTGSGEKVGGLVGENTGTIRACYATGDATGAVSLGNSRVGGLVGQNTGGTIRACYATGNATGTGSGVGGLVGVISGAISACYATGDASGSSNVGGLVGLNFRVTISACYATGDASGSSAGGVGGLVGGNSGGTVTNSYFDHEASNRPVADPYSKTTAQLQTPTVYDDNADATDGSSIYEAWNVDVDNGLAVGVDDGTAAGDSDTDDPWDFGTDSEYPELKVDFNVDGTPSVAEFGTQPRAVFRVFSFTPERGVVGATVTISGQNFSTTATDNTVTFLGAEGDADNAAATVSTSPAPTTTELTVTVPPAAKTGPISVMVGAAANTSSQDFTVLEDKDENDNGLIEVNSLEQLYAIRYDLDGDGVPSGTDSQQAAYRTAFGLSGAGAAASCTGGCVGYELMSNLDFNDIDATMMGDQLSIWSENCADGACQIATAVNGNNADKVGWPPIGDNSNTYTATFDGNDYTISNLYINRSSTSNVGLFGALGIDGNLRNLGIEGGSLSGAGNVGGLVGRSSGTISDCHATGDANGAGNVGGLLGENLGTISDCHATVNVTASQNNVGGLVGWNNGGTISDCHATGDVRGSIENVGGLVGSNEGGVITNSSAMGNVTGSGSYVGGLVGDNKNKGSTNATISACYATGNANGGGFVGGLVGLSTSATISACYATGNATTTGGNVGGLLGGNVGSTISACYATGDATGSGVAAGGLVGANQGTISACYATGNATSGSRGAGGLVGGNQGPVTACYSTGNASGAHQVGGLVGVNATGGTVTNSYFDSDVSNRSTSDPYDKTTAQLQTPTAYDDNTDATDGSSIYEAWNLDVDNAQPIGVDDGTAVGDDTVDDPWDFGTDSEYPALRVDFDVDGMPSVADFGMQPRTAFRVSSFTPMSGVVGATVTIRGKLFSATATDNTVTFLGAEGDADNAEVMVSTLPAATTTELTVTVPPNAQTGPISVMVGTAADTSLQDFAVLIGEDKDANDNGLIEVSSLEQLDAIRHDLDGDGVPSGTDPQQAAYRTAFELSGAGAAASCTGGCVGYELMSNLDFDNLRGAPSIWSEDCTDGTCQTAAAVDGDNADKVGWKPIGGAFTATFDGNNYVISNLYIHRSSTGNVGLFRTLGTGGNVRNLGIEGGSLSGKSRVGGLAGANNGGTISACYTTGNASGASDVGGLVGRSDGTISDCHATGHVTGSSVTVGGLVGWNEGGTIRASYATGTVTGSGNNVGGLTGSNEGGAIRACYATGTVTGSGDHVGGLAGVSKKKDATNATISACYATGNATGTNQYVGGLVGWNAEDCTIGACYATGNANGDNNVGGLVGRNQGTISACYATGNASGSSLVGGLVGNNFAGTVTNSYFDSTVSNRTDSDDHAKTTTDLQTPTAYDGNADATDGSSIYETWNIDVDDGQLIGVDDGTMAGDDTADDPWEFGTASQYPALRVDFDVDGAPSVVEFGMQPRTAFRVSSFTPERGIVGAMVTITGRGFSETATDNTVTFLGAEGGADDVEAMVSAASTTELTVTVPDGAMTGRIQVAVSGEMASSTTDFRVLILSPYMDADGLIDVTTLAQLDAIRYDLDGDGRPTSAGQMAWQTAFLAAATVDDDAAVPDVSTGFTGYELRSNLDFDNVGGSPSIWSENCTDGACQTATAVDGDNADKVGWAPLGGTFAATFDGRGHTISNLYINRPSTSYVGLFGLLGTGGNVRNLGIEGGSLTGNGDVGGLVGDNSGTISACYTTGTVTGSADNVGGLVGRNFGGTISACYATGDASGSGVVGGLVGWNQGAISACYATGDASGSGVVGGLVGYSQSTIRACYATGNATGTADDVGGLVGFSQGTISACYATGNVTGSADNVGGLVGFNEGPISACYTTGDASGADNVGGLVGNNAVATISACYATGNASGSSSVGGLVGNNIGTISACYATGNATGTGNNVGGLVGGGSGTVTNSYFDSTVSNRTDSDDYSKTTTQLQTPTAYGTAMEIYANWNIDVDNGADAGVDDGTMPGDAAADDPWDFGTDSQYPVLKVDFNVNGSPTAFEFGGQGRVSTTVPDALAALTATAANAEVTLSWTAAASGDGAPITGYMIEYSVSADFSSPPTTRTTAAAATSYTVSGLTNGTLYYFRVAAVNAAGTAAYYPGMGDAAVSATPATVPAAPSALLAMAANAAVTLSWTAAVNDGGAAITGYMIEHSLMVDFSSPTTATTMNDATSYTVSGLTNGTLYYFRVAAVNAAGTSAYYPGAGGTAVSATPAPTVPAAPSALTATAADAKVTLSWDAPVNDGGAAITGYMLEYDTDMNFPSPTPATTAAAATSHTVSALTNATPYYFRVAAVNAVGTGAYYPGATDAAVSATPAAPVVSSFTPTSGAVDTEVKIWGTSFSSTATEDSISFGGSAYVVASGFIADTRVGLSPTVDTLVVSVPSDAQTGKISVKVLDGMPAMSTVDFTVTPVVSSFTPTSGAVDTEVKIWGTSFSSTATEDSISFGGSAYVVASSFIADTRTGLSPTVDTLVVSVPPAAQTGKISVKVLDGMPAMSTVDFTVTAPAPDPPVVSSFTPTSGAVDATVTITGTGFSATATENTVVFLGAEGNDADNAAATVSTSPAPTATSLSVSVPSTAQTGKISVMVGTAADTSAASFTVTATAPAPAAPVVSSFSPTEGEVDTEVTITGVNFSATPSANEVRFGGVMAAAPTSASTTSLVVLVPSGAVTGRVSVAVGGQTGTSSENFTVTAPAPAPSAPVVSSFSPTEGEVDTEVTITGVNFSATPSANEVRFGGVMAADPTSASTTSLVVLVPSGAVTGRISVAVGGQTGTSSENFTVTAPAPAPSAPVVSSFSPTEGEVDTEVTITGVNFSDMSSENEVRFGGVMAAAPTSASTTSLVVLVPSGAVTGRISVAVGGQTGTSSTDFTVTGTTPAPEPPVVSSFTPTEGEVGTSVTITGENFSDMPSENEVKFGGVMAAAPTSASTTSLTVLVPSGARTGSISVAVGGQTGTSSESFTVTAPAPAPEPPVVSSFTPSEGVVGTSVTITGDNFSATPSENEVRFGGVMAAAPTSASATSLTILVPSGARTGSISVAVGGQTGTSSENFTVTAPAPAPAPPVVSSFSPTEGVVGTSVTITGDNFSATPSENDLRFGGVMAAAPTSASTTSLTVLVPSGARTGSISVAVGGQTGTSSESFTVTAPAPVSPFSVPLSSEGDVRLYPNPTSGQLHFKGLLAGGRYVCDLYSLVGQKVLSSVVRAGDTMDTSTLFSGQYILILQAEGRELMRTRLLVVR